MSFFRVLLSIFFPPLSVIDQGCGWVPGVIAALVILNNPERWSSRT